MKPFMDKDFLLENDFAKRLYHEYAENLPIIDYHCHIHSQDIAENSTFSNIAQALLGKGNYGDHYLWRIIRACGVTESEITGDAPDRIRFQKLAESIPNAIGNPVYQWLHMELQKYFDFHDPLNADNAEEAWNTCNKTIENGLSVHDVLKKTNVELIVTTDDPIDDLKWHSEILKDEKSPCKVIPAMRPDKVINIESSEFNSYIEKMSEVSGVKIIDLNSFKAALVNRMDYFEKMGCKVTDHGLDYIPNKKIDEKEWESIFSKKLEGKQLSDEEVEGYKTCCLTFFGREYAKRGWVMQLHYGARRNVNSRMYRMMGPDTGFDSISDKSNSQALAVFLDNLNEKGLLPKTILYSLNPNDNAMICTTMACFQGEVKGKLQHGCPWWFNDNKKGMEEQLTNLANQGVLGNFIGMLTDSRSFFSYVRHDYFRRVLCNLVGSWVEKGEYPDDLPFVGKIIQNISYHNAKEYFGF